MGTHKSVLMAMKVEVVPHFRHGGKSHHFKVNNSGSIKLKMAAYIGTVRWRLMKTIRTTAMQRSDSTTGFTRKNIHRKALTITICLVALIVIAGCIQAPMPASLPDQSTAEEAIHSLYDAIRRGDTETVGLLVDSVDSDSEAYLSGMKALAQSGATLEISDLVIEIVDNQGTTVRAHSRFHVKIIQTSGAIYFDGKSSDQFTLIMRNDRWYFRGLGHSIPPGWIAP